jgi:MFS transporter, DHA1 family, tetracycline resistance protein
LIGRLTKIFGENKLFIAGAAIIALGLIGIPFATAVWGVLAATALLAIGMGLLSPSMNSLISQEASAEERGNILGLSQSAQSLARIVGPAVAGAVYGGLGRNAPYVLSALAMAGVVFLSLRLLRGRR